MRDYYEELWERLPASLHPPDWSLRLGFLRDNAMPEDRALDLGCGDGAFTGRARAARSREVVGADVAQAALRRARARHPSIEFRLLPIDGPLPFDDNAFDLVWSSEVIEHVADTARWLSEVRRVLAPGRPAAVDDSQPRAAAIALARRRALLRAARRSPAPVHAPIADGAAARVRLCPGERRGRPAASPACAGCCWDAPSASAVVTLGQKVAAAGAF